MITIILLILVGLLSGVLSGLFGIGGGIIIVPALIYLCGFDQLKAQGTSLAILLPPVGLAAFIQYYKAGNVDIKAGVLICAFLVIGSYFGARLTHLLPVDVLKKSFAILMIAISLKMLFGK